MQVRNAQFAAWIAEARTSRRHRSYEGKRDEPRYLWVRQMELRVGDETLFVSSVNISEEGFGLQCRRALEPFTRVAVRRPGEREWIPAVVIRCTPSLNGYQLGLGVDDQG